MTIRPLPFLCLALVFGGCDKQATDTATPEPQTTSASDTAAKPEVKPIPAGYFALTPNLTVQGVDAAVAFYVKAFGAQKLMAMPGDDGETVHAEVRIGDSVVMIEREMPEGRSKAPKTLGGTPATLMMYVDKVDDAFATAVAAGATVQMPLADQFWGDRYGVLIDPEGHRWALASHIEDLTPEQMGQRAQLAMDPKAVAKAKKAGKKAKPPAWAAIVGAPATDPTPAPYHSVNLALTSQDADAAIAFYTTVFGAVEKDRMADPSGKIAHAELTFGDSILMISDELPEMGGKSAATLGGSPVSIMHYVPDVDSTFAAAQKGGATPAQPVSDMFWGDRFGVVVDPFGYPWGIATHKEDLTPEQMEQRRKAQGAKS